MGWRDWGDIWQVDIWYPRLLSAVERWFVLAILGCLALLGWCAVSVIRGCFG